MNKITSLLFPALLAVALLPAPQARAQKIVPVSDGWAANSVNTTVFRKNSLVTHKKLQFVAFYAPDGQLVLGRRKLGQTQWELNRTQYKGNVRDAHNSISLMVDGDGYLHVSWDHHGHPLRYAVGTEPLSLTLGDKRPMTGSLEKHVTYPEFYRMPSGDLVFLYRDGGSGQGNLVMNRYDLRSRTWRQVHRNLVDGQGERNAYWQACMDGQGVFHLSWVWRETGDVATNHDMCYARSRDGGLTWENSSGQSYRIPIDAASAEYAVRIPQQSELINSTSMTADEKGFPYIATYWREAGTNVPQYHVVYHDGRQWHALDLGFRRMPFSLSGHGTKRIPISRPQIVARSNGGKPELMMLFRDEERGSRVSLAVLGNDNSNVWKVSDLTEFSVGSWEPSFDTELWREKGRLHVFVQRTDQTDAEGVSALEPQPVYVLEVK